jgi:predicted TIM-barrel fold metal-dependent hydrolase
LARFAGNELFLGIRISGQVLAKRIGEAAFLDHLRRLADLHRELDLVGGAQMLPDVVRLTGQIPALRIVLDHLPLDPPTDEAKRKAADQAFDELRNHPQVFAKVSEVLRKVEGKVVTDVAVYRERLDRIWRIFGAERVIYGSNWPVSDKVAPYQEVLTVVQEYVRLYQAESRDRYFCKNARCAYAWPE